MSKPEWYQGLVMAHYRGKHQIRAVLDEEDRIRDERKRAESEAIRLSGVR